MSKILIVDDAVFMRLAIRKILEEHGGFEVIEEAENGIEALKKYKALKPDIVMMDITMPDMNGLDALKAIIECDSNAKVVMVSAMGQEHIVMEAVMNGAKSFIVKPFKEEQVIQTLSKLL